MRARKGIRRLVRILGIVLTSLVGVIVIALLLLLLRPIRSEILDHALHIAGDTLPGDISATTATWPRLGRLEITGLSWTLEDRELVGADSLSVEVDLGALWRKDVHVEELVGRGLRADVPRIVFAFADTTAVETPEFEEEDSDSPAFPRPGALAPLPSIGVDRTRLSVQSLVLSDSLTLRAELDLGAELRADHPPTLDVRRVDAVWLEREWTVRSEGLALDARSGETRGRVALALGPGRNFDLELGSAADGHFDVGLAESGDDPSRGDPGLAVSGTLERRPNGLISRLDFEALLRTPEPARIDTLLGRPGLLDPAAPLGAILVRADGELVVGDTLRTRANVAIEPTGWPGRLTASLQTDGALVQMEELRLESAGLTALARGSFEDGNWTGHVDARLDSIGPLAAFVDPDALPPDLVAELSVEASGEDQRVRPVVRVTARAPSASLDSLAFDARGMLDGPRTDLAIQARALVAGPLALALDARVLDLEQPRIHLAPVRVRSTLAELGPPSDLPADPTLRLDPESRQLRVDRLEVTGALGELRLDADVAQDSGGNARMTLRWPTPPEALALIGLDAGARDSLLAPGWDDGAVPGVQIDLDLASGMRSGTLQAGLELPAPWTLVSGLDPELYRAPHLVGGLQARWDEPNDWRADLDFTQTAWLDSAFVHAGAEAGLTRLDSLLVKGGPLRLTAAARIDSAEVDGKFQLDVLPHPALYRVVSGLPPDLQFLLNLRGAVQGAPDAPDARIRLLSSARSPALELPLLTAEIEIVGGEPRIGRVEIPEPASVGQFVIDRARIEVAPEDPAAGLIPISLAAEIRGDVDWVQNASVDSTNGTWTVRTDSLIVGARGRHMTSQQPFQLSLTPADSTIVIDGMELSGDPGTVSASLDLGPRHARADLEAHLDASLPSVLVRMPPQMLPSGYHLIFKGTETDLDASVWIEGLDLGIRRDILARVEARREGDRFDVAITARDELGQLADGELTLPLAADLLNRRFEWRDGPLTGTVAVDSLPLPYKLGGDEGFGAALFGAGDAASPLLDARIGLGGTGRQPVAGALVDIEFPGIEDLNQDRIDVRAIWVGKGGDPASLGLFEDADLIERLRAALPHGGVAASASLLRQETPAARFTASLPLAADAASPLPGFGPDDEIRFRVEAEPLRLGEWSALAPSGTEVDGEFFLTASGEGPIGDLPLDVAMRLNRVRFEQSFGSSATLDGQLKVTGRTSAPVIEGQIRVPSALIRLPDSGRDLHPVSGESRLWNLVEMSPNRFAALDTLDVDWGWTFSSPDSTETEEAGLTLAESTRLDVGIEIPNSFWIRGQGLEVQLSGELEIDLVDGQPRLVGELRAIGGSLEVVGARLRLQSGTVTFYGGDTTDPTLDLELTREQGDVRVIVRVTGTALKPRLEFDSDPPMAQADIMSYLIFGSPSDDLDGAQTQLLQDQAVAALSQFAAPMLENELTQALGITMVQLQAGEDPEDGLSLVVGKYLTPKILLKYEQSLKDRQKYTVEAEYWLNRSFRVETQLSETQSTGIFLNWSTDY